MVAELKLLQVVLYAQEDTQAELSIALQAINRVNTLLEATRSRVRLAASGPGSVPPRQGIKSSIAADYLSIEDCDIFICPFWYRFGAPPGTRRADGTPFEAEVQELVERAYTASLARQGQRPRLMIYRKMDALPAGMREADHRQYGRLLEFLDQFKAGGRHPALIYLFSGDQLENLLEEHLLAVILEFETQETAGEAIEKRETMMRGGARHVGSKRSPKTNRSDLEPIKNRWALVVGVNQFESAEFSRLKWCVNDAQKLAETLVGLGYEVIAFHDDAGKGNKPSSGNILSRLKNILDLADPADLVWVHFSCHGFLRDGEPVLAVADTYQNEVERTAIVVRDLQARMKAGGHRRLLLTLDACHTGIEERRDLADPEFIHNVHELAEGIVTIAGSTSQQIAQEIEGLQHGVFSYFMLEALKPQTLAGKKKFITANDLANYLLDQLRRWRARHGGAIQDPNVQLSGIGDLIIADFRKSKEVS